MGDGISTCPQMGPTKGGSDDAPNATLISAESHQSPHRSEGGAGRRSLAQLMGRRAGYEDRR
jgi:hypothetical protein